MKNCHNYDKACDALLKFFKGLLQDLENMDNNLQDIEIVNRHFLEMTGIGLIRDDKVKEKLESIQLRITALLKNTFNDDYSRN